MIHYAYTPTVDGSWIAVFWEPAPRTATRVRPFLWAQRVEFQTWNEMNSEVSRMGAVEVERPVIPFIPQKKGGLRPSQGALQVLKIKTPA